MQRFLPIALAALAAGCAATQDNTQLAQANCRVVPLTTARIAGAKPRGVEPLDQRWAEMQLAGSDYRLRELRRHGSNNMIEDALRDCDRAATQ